MLISATVQAE